MTNLEKAELRRLCQSGRSFKSIKLLVSCSDKTIRRYLKIFAPEPPKSNPKDK